METGEGVHVAPFELYKFGYCLILLDFFYDVEKF